MEANVETVGKRKHRVSKQLVNRVKVLALNWNIAKYYVTGERDLGSS